MHPAQRLALAGLAWLAAAGSLAADPTVHNDAIPQGTARFDAVVAGAGAVLQLQPLHLLEDGARQFTLPGFSITAIEGGPQLVDDDYNQLRAAGHVGALSGSALGMVPGASSASAGLRFQFNQPVNAFGIELGDWATCCFASSLHIAFDGGASRLVATARSASDNPGLARYGQHTNFIGAIDTSGQFQQVTLSGVGAGEYLVAGGTIRFASLPLGSVAAVPEPPAVALWLAGLLALACLHRRRAAERESALLHTPRTQVRPCPKNSTSWSTAPPASPAAWSSNTC